MQIILPDVDWRKHPEWTIPGQLRKIGEETGEEAEAVAANDPVNAIREALDAIQTHMTLISMIAETCWADGTGTRVLAGLIQEHTEKLERKRYL